MAQRSANSGRASRGNATAGRKRRGAARGPAEQKAAAGAVTAPAAASSDPSKGPARRRRAKALDAEAALATVGAGGSYRDAAVAAGSLGRGGASLSVIGKNICDRGVHQLGTRAVAMALAAERGLTFERFLDNLSERMDAVRKVRVLVDGQVDQEWDEPDYSARAKACEQYMRLIGLHDLPVEREGGGPRTALAALSGPELQALVEFEQAAQSAGAQ